MSSESDVIREIRSLIDQYRSANPGEEVIVGPGGGVEVVPRSPVEEADYQDRLRYDRQRREQAAAVPSSAKPVLRGLAKDDPATPEGKYLVQRRDGTVVEWMHFVLGARDPHSPAALRAYAASIALDPDCHPDLAARVRRLADEFDAYRAAHGAGDPTRGLHRVDDPATVAKMRRGMSS